MTNQNQNNAAHDIGTSSGGRAYMADYFATQLRRHDFAKYINSTLAADFACALAEHLSKLRAEGVQAGDERAKLPPLPEPRIIYNGEDDIDEEVYDGDQMKEYARAALASAPVAGEAPTDDEIIDMAVEPLGIDCDRMPYSIVVFARTLLGRYAAPQASEAAPVCSCPTGDGSLRWPCAVHSPKGAREVAAAAERFALSLTQVAYLTKRGAVYGGEASPPGSERLCTISQAVYEFRAAPQASEAVRNQALEEAAELCEAEICSCCWDEDAQAAATHLTQVIRALKQPQADKAAPACSCPTGDGSLRWPCAVHPPPQRDTQPHTDGGANG